MARNATKGLSPIGRAAAVIVALGSDEAASVYKYLTEDEIERLSVEVAKLEKLKKKTRLKENAKRKFDIFASTCEEILEQAKNHKAGAEHQLKMLEKAKEIAADYEDISLEEEDELTKEIMGKIGVNF